MKLNSFFLLRFIVLAVALWLPSCASEQLGLVLPPDYVEPDNNEPDGGNNTGNGSGSGSSVYEKYIFPKVDGSGRIIVAGRPPQYTDTARYHVVSVGYDLSANKPVDLEVYYAAAVGKKGDELKQAIAAIITSGYTGITYGDVRYRLAETDQDPLNPAQVWCFYLENTATATWDGGIAWNREHVWAQSKGLGESAANNKVNTASDLHNLKPEIPSINSSKGNRDFCEQTGNSSYTGTVGSGGYAPAKSGRGDVARILLYMELRWNATNSLQLDHTVSASSGQPRQGKLSDLLKWHNDDPVDPYEIHRNNVVYKYQKNRNPFIDHPELVEYIWGEYQDKAWDGGVVFKQKSI